MSKLNTLHDLLVASVKDLFSAENQLVKALPKMAKAATHPDLKAGFKTHLEQTKEHVARLEHVAELLGASPRGKSTAPLQVCSSSLCISPMDARYSVIVRAPESYSERARAPQPLTS